MRQDYISEKLGPGLEPHNLCCCVAIPRALVIDVMVWSNVAVDGAAWVAVTAEVSVPLCHGISGVQAPQAVHNVITSALGVPRLRIAVTMRVYKDSDLR